MKKRCVNLKPFNVRRCSFISGNNLHSFDYITFLNHETVKRNFKLKSKLKLITRAGTKVPKFDKSRVWMSFRKMAEENQIFRRKTKIIFELN